MSPKLARIEAMLFRADSVRFEACATFRAAEDPSLCACGWLEDDHATRVAPAARVRHFPRRRPPRVLVSRAS
jgi:hypothetical protein